MVAQVQELAQVAQEQRGIEIDPIERRSQIAFELLGDAWRPTYSAVRSRAWADRQLCRHLIPKCFIVG